LLLALLDWVPFCYLLSLVLKINLLRSTNNWHGLIYRTTFLHLREFDVFEFAWEHLSHRLVWGIQKLLNGTEMVYSRLSEEQLEELKKLYEKEVENLERELENKKGKSIRNNNLMRKSIFFMDASTADLENSVLIHTENYANLSLESIVDTNPTDRQQPKKTKSPPPKREKSFQKKDK